MSVQNPQQGNEAAEALTDQRQQKAEQRQEGMSAADRILQARSQKTVTLELEGMDVDFQTMLGQTRDEVDDIQMEVNDLAGKLDDAEAKADDTDDVDVEAEIGMSEDEAVDKVENIRDRFVEIITEHAVDESLTEDFWLEAYGRSAAGNICMRLKQKSERADMTEEELEGF